MLSDFFALDTHSLTTTCTRSAIRMAQGQISPNHATIVPPTMLRVGCLRSRGHPLPPPRICIAWMLSELSDSVGLCEFKRVHCLPRGGTVTPPQSNHSCVLSISIYLSVCPEISRILTAAALSSLWSVACVFFCTNFAQLIKTDEIRNARFSTSSRRLAWRCEGRSAPPLQRCYVY